MSGIVKLEDTNGPRTFVVEHLRTWLVERPHKGDMGRAMPLRTLVWVCDIGYPFVVAGDHEAALDTAFYAHMRGAL